MASNPFKVWGITKITVGGVLLNTEPKPSFEPGGPENTPVDGDFMAGFHSTAMKPSKVECTVLVTAGFSLTWLQGISNETIQVVTDAGQTWIIRNGYTSGQVTATEGKAKVTFMGPPAIEELS